MTRLRGSNPTLARLLVAATMLAIALVNGPVAWLVAQTRTSVAEPRLLEAAIRTTAVMLAIRLCFQARKTSKERWRARQRFDQAPGRPAADAPIDAREANREILQAMVRVSQKYSPAAIRLFGQMLIEPGRYQVRITDEVEPVGDCLKVTVSTTYTSYPDDLAELDKVGNHPDAALPKQVQRAEPSQASLPSGPANGGSAATSGVRTLARERAAEPATEETLGARVEQRRVMLIPLIMTTKGTMLDNVDTFDGGAESIPFLSQEDARGVVAHVVQTVFEDTFGPGKDGVLFALLRLVFRQGRVSAEDAETYFDQAITAISNGTSDSDLAKLKGICAFLVRNYIVIAEVPPPTGYKWVLRYTKTIPLYGRVDTPERKRRVRMGLQPNTFVIPLNLPFTANSYHFRMQAGGNSYVKLHSVQWAKTGGTVRQTDIQEMSDRAYLRVRHRQALPYAHLYTRRFDTCPSPKDLVMQVDFEEVPPGALGLTFSLAFLSAFVITLLAFAVPVNDGTRVSGDVLAFLLAISPVAATFVGFSMEKLQRSSLTTFTGLTVTGLTSLAAALLYVKQVPQWMIHPVALPLFGEPKVNIAVFAVGLGACVNAVYLYWRLRDELTHYVKLLSEKNTTTMMFR